MKNRLCCNGSHGSKKCKRRSSRMRSSGEWKQSKRKFWLPFKIKYEFTMTIAIEVPFRILQCDTKQLLLWWLRDMFIITKHYYSFKPSKKIIYCLPWKKPFTKNCYILIHFNWARISLKAGQDEFDLKHDNFYSQSNTTSQADPPFFSLFVKTPPETWHRIRRCHF